MLRTMAIPATLVNDVMRYSRSRRQVLLLDYCHSGAFARGLVVGAGQVMSTGEYFKEARGQVVLTASDALQYSFEGDQIKGEGVRSVFTHTLLRGSHKGLALAAQSALTKLADDDSRLVSTAAAKSLAAFAEVQRPVEVERQVEQLPTEKAERIAEKPQVEPFAPEPVKPPVRKKPAGQAWNWGRLRLPLALVALLGLAIGGVAIGLLGGGQKPTPTRTTPSPRVRETDGALMVYVPGGIFQMGSAEGNAEVQPVHSVTLDSFWIDQTEVTNAQYACCVAAGLCVPPYKSRSASHLSYYGDSQFDDYPVIYVTWDQARTYCQWAGGRLPTEAEWEYAARGPDGHVYPWGNDPPNDTLANYTRNEGDTTQVGAYPGGQSWVGTMDMAGNVFEWVNDWYGSYPSEPQMNPTGPATGAYWVLRGGGWSSDEEHLRAANRYGYLPGARHQAIGFRCVVEPGG
jgi:formylglycine-generating enzyme required for sulfatase activity